jgi:GNAT superfamily N-acetyltransferase
VAADPTLIYGALYREVATLGDGTEVLLRAVHPDDKDRLREGFARLSPESRYLRFHGAKTELTDAELRYLTELDGVRHYAIAGLVRDEGVGVARMVQLDGEPGVAEAAITVVDGMQGRGLGTLLFQRLFAAAAERGVARIRCLVLGSNQPMQDLLRRLAGPDAHARVEAGVVSFDIPLPAPERPRDSGLYELLRLAARRVVTTSVTSDSST